MLSEPDNHSFASPDTHRSLGGKPPKPAFQNPFSTEGLSPSPSRPIKDILKQIIEVDFERIVAEKQLNPKKLPVNQVY